MQYVNRCTVGYLHGNTRCFTTYQMNLIHGAWPRHLLHGIQLHWKRINGVRVRRNMSGMPNGCVTIQVCVKNFSIWIFHIIFIFCKVHPDLLSNSLKRALESSHFALNLAVVPNIVHWNAEWMSRVANVRKSGIAFRSTIVTPLLRSHYTRCRFIHHNRVSVVWFDKSQPVTFVSFFF